MLNGPRAQLPQERFATNRSHLLQVLGSIEYCNILKIDETLTKKRFCSPYHSIPQKQKT